MIALHSFVSLFLTGIYLILLIYLIRGWSKVKVNQTKATTFKTRITVLIAARNEEEKINLTIEDVLAQNYPKHLLEIIIVDDHSTDNTAAIISSYASQGVKLLKLHEEQPLNSYKKKAIAEAIKLSTGELMVATDADCRMGTAWLSSIVGYYESNNLVMVSSPVTYFEEKSLFELMQTLEFGFLIGIGAAFIGNGRASTCNGANFAYRKDVFYEVGGFKGIDELASGDDELLLQKVAERYPGKIGFLKQTEAVVYTHAKHSLQEFMQQRRRWASKSTKYKDKKVVAFGICIWLFNLSLLVNAALGFYDFYFFKLFLVQFLLKYLFEIVYLLPIAGFFKRTYLVSLLVLMIPLHIVYFVVIGLMGNNHKYLWKGRVVK
ncbi:glycosyltransferase [Mucilaginibacter sp. SP1R1]|uniref:glycosyltransferase n=1 Tax=Mucilaginibacter sp. SP1R1 TaxID=2723091 RepID=UPI001609AAD7|nr:glycosyltransferase [Mucilaginibacter sp. SP1R1]MBB6150383.1 cellulose synthase/poly-beta-1,6-N-acetylglucosamine synthase-like glycosyltransferase [Mucilaginibacter sp. SP1R1]